MGDSTASFKGTFLYVWVLMFRQKSLAHLVTGAIQTLKLLWALLGCAKRLKKARSCIFRIDKSYWTIRAAPPGYEDCLEHGGKVCSSLCKGATRYKTCSAFLPFIIVMSIEVLGKCLDRELGSFSNPRGVFHIWLAFYAAFLTFREFGFGTRFLKSIF